MTKLSQYYPNGSNGRVDGGNQSGNRCGFCLTNVAGYASINVYPTGGTNGQRKRVRKMLSIIWFVFACIALIIGGGTSILSYLFIVAWFARIWEKRSETRNT